MNHPSVFFENTGFWILILSLHIPKCEGRKSGIWCELQWCYVCPTSSSELQSPWWELTVRKWDNRCSTADALEEYLNISLHGMWLCISWEKSSVLNCLGSSALWESAFLKQSFVGKVFSLHIDEKHLLPVLYYRIFLKTWTWNSAVVLCSPLPCGDCCYFCVS